MDLEDTAGMATKNLKLLRHFYWQQSTLAALVGSPISKIGQIAMVLFDGNLTRYAPPECQSMTKMRERFQLEYAYDIFNLHEYAYV